MKRNPFVAVKVKKEKQESPCRGKGRNVSAVRQGRPPDSAEHLRDAKKGKNVQRPGKKTRNFFQNLDTKKKKTGHAAQVP